MKEHVRQQLNAFNAAIAPWCSAYQTARLSFIAVHCGDFAEVISARIYLAVNFREHMKERFQAGTIVAGQIDIPLDTESIELIIERLVSRDGFEVEAYGRLRLPLDEGRELDAGPPVLLHPEGIHNGSRIGVLAITGGTRHELVPQPMTDWMLKAGERPFDSLAELSAEYGLGNLAGHATLLEIVAYAAVEVSALTAVKGNEACLGIWIAKDLERSTARLGYRVLDKGAVVLRGSACGEALSWGEHSGDLVGFVRVNVPRGAIVQCFASYGGHAHHQRWFADPETFQNPRAAVLASVDQTGQLLRGYLLPELPPKGKAADDFESAVSWVLWTLGFAPVSFGMNSKTRDAFDIVAASPRGDMLVVECTLGLLRAESKLSKLSAREASTKELLGASGMHHLRVLPVIVTAMTKDQVKADLAQAAETGVLVLTREDLEAVIDNEQLRFANADQLVDKALQRIAESRAKPGGANLGSENFREGA